MPFKIGKRERAISSYLKMVGHIRSNVILFDDGSVFGMLSAEGLPWETAEIEDILRSGEDFNLAFRNVAYDNLTILTYQCRGAAHPSIYPERQFPSEFAERLNRKYRQKLFENTLYRNQIFIGVLVRPARYMGDFMAEQVAKRSKPAEDAPEDRLRRLDDTCALLQARLAGYGLQRLGLRERRQGVFSEIAEALVFAMTGIWRPIGLSTGRMANALFSERLIFGREAIEIRTPGWSSYAAMFGIREYPASHWLGMFDAMSRTRYYCTVFQSFRFLAKATAETIMNRKQNFMLGAEDKAYEQVAQLHEAGNDLLSNKFVLGDHSLSFITFADTMPALRSVATEAWRNLSEGGAVVAREGMALEAAYFSMFPGNDKLRPRPGYISSRAFVSMAPMRNSPAGPARGHWGGPIAILRNSDGSAFRFHWHVGDVGNTLITGETGSGKSLTAAFLMALTTGRSRIFMIDYKRGWELLTRALGGDYAILGDGQPHLAPLKALSPTPQNMRFLSDLLHGCIGQQLTSEEERRLALGLRIVMAQPPEDRSLAEIRAFLGTTPNGAGAALERWCWGNDLGWVIDAPENTVNLHGDIHGFDMTSILDNPRARGPALATLFHYILLQLDGRPIIIPNDEGWKALLEQQFRPMIERIIRTIRSLGGIFVFLTQGPGEIKTSDIGSVLVEQCPTQIRLPVDRATKADYTEVLKSTEGEWEAFRALKKGSGMMLICQGGTSAVVELPLKDMEDEIAILSARQTTLEEWDAVRNEKGGTVTLLLEETQKRRRLKESKIRELAECAD